MANPIDRRNQGFESESNGGWLLGPKDKIEKIEFQGKLSVAHKLLDALSNILVPKS